jgi:plasmid stability protein
MVGTAIIDSVKQLITRLDDGLHARLKAQAAAQGRSLNDLVTEVLAAAVGQPMTRQLVRARAQAADLLVWPPTPERVVTRDEALGATRGLGAAASGALDAERGER